MSKSVIETVQTASTHLNDYGQTFWTKERLINHLAEAHRELQVELFLAGVAVLKKTSSIIQVAAVASPTPGQSVDLDMTSMTDIIEPIAVLERMSGDTYSSFTQLTQKSWEPEVVPVTELVYWVWRGEKIKLLVPTTNREVKVQYHASIPIPTADDDVLGFIFAELYIAPRLAALAAGSIGSERAHNRLTQLAESRLEKIIAANIKAEQALPVRRKPYRRGRSTIIR